MTTRDPARPVRIANCSGFYGDRFRAPHELLNGPDPIDVLTGDYLAELTMLILHKARLHDPNAGYARTFLQQMQDVLGNCIDRGIKVVSNAGGLNPHGLAARIREIDPRAKVAVVDGDDVRDQLQEHFNNGGRLHHLDTFAAMPIGTTLATANAYLGGWGIAAALDNGADVVVCGRVTDASLVVGPAAWWYGWRADDPDGFDRLAGAVVAGHVIECGPQCCGGNYPFLDELVPGSIGFPIAEVHADGSSIITKQPGTGGAVNIGTVTAQLLYEIGAPEYLGPDVKTYFDTVEVAQAGADRVRISGGRGLAPSQSLKVAVNLDGGYRNSMTLMLTGLDIERKATHVANQLFESLGDRDQFDEVSVELIRSDHDNALSNAQALAQLRITVKDRDREKVGRRFSGAVVELALASYAGMFVTTPPGDANAYGVYWPVLIDRSLVTHTVTHDDGTETFLRGTIVAPASAATLPGARSSVAHEISSSATPVINKSPQAALTSAAHTIVALGSICGARSGDKGPNANVGVWTWDNDLYAFLCDELSVDRFRELVPDADGLTVDRYLLPNLKAMNFIVHGLLGEGVASCTRIDAQAKGLGEYLRSRSITIPDSLRRAVRA